MKLGISIKIDVTKLDKSRFFTGQKGTYADLTVFIDSENPSQYGDHGGIAQSATQEERANGVKLPFVGNAKIFWNGQSQPNQNQGYQNQPQNSNQGQNQQGYQPQNQNGYNQPNQNQNGQQSGNNQSQGSDSDIPF